MLGHQIPTLQPFESFWVQLADFFAWLEGKPIAVLPPMPETEASDPTWQPPATIALPSAWGLAVPIESIRFAGANRLMIELTYLPEMGRAGIRRVEPYSFRRSQTGHLLFYGRNIERPRISAYRFERI